jgi:hypothetical protein
MQFLLTPNHNISAAEHIWPLGGIGVWVLWARFGQLRAGPSDTAYRIFSQLVCQLHFMIAAVLLKANA